MRIYIYIEREREVTSSLHRQVLYLTNSYESQKESYNHIKAQETLRRKLG